MGTSSELVDYAIIEAPDGTQLKVRTLYDTGATDSLLDWKLAKYFHQAQDVRINQSGINTSATTSTHICTIKVILIDGSSCVLKAIKSDMSAPGFTLKRKTIDIPPRLSQHITRSNLHVIPTNDIGDTRYTNPVENYNVQLLLGTDNVAYMPYELDRHADEGGQVILFRSIISGMILPCGSRRTGRTSTTGIKDGQLRTGQPST